MGKKKYYDEADKAVSEFKTKNEEGFTNDEMKELLKNNFEGINMDKFYNAMMGNTCMVIGDEIINYHCDVEKALRCGLENRDLTIGEWD